MWAKILLCVNIAKELLNCDKNLILVNYCSDLFCTIEAEAAYLCPFRRKGGGGERCGLDIATTCLTFSNIQYYRRMVSPFPPHLFIYKCVVISTQSVSGVRYNIIYLTTQHLKTRNSPLPPSPFIPIQPHSCPRRRVPTNFLSFNFTRRRDSS